ncbi:MAG: hypothetical protein M1838_005648 [Thelocarpon superellum]|nr:MAG: hypothetical protein M1838_005648 [Thelocarpon superellum]
MPEDLATLFARNLSLTPDPTALATRGPPAVDEPSPDHRPETPHGRPIQYSISQHYHHSAHLASSAPATPLPAVFAPAPADPTSSPPTSAEQLLSAQGIDPTTLHPRQLILFQQADASQQLRLVELWRISGGDRARAIPNVAVPEVSHPSMQDGSLARLHLERALFEERRKWGYGDVQGWGVDQRDWHHANARPMTGLTQRGGGEALDDSHAVPEPYITAGYNKLAQPYPVAGSPSLKTSPMAIGADAGEPWIAEAPLSVSALDPVYRGPDLWRELMAQQEMARGFGMAGPAIVPPSEDEEMT